MFDQSTECVITALNKHIQTFGTFSLLHTDSDSQFTSLTFRNYCKFFGAEHRLSSIRYPQCNGLAERYIKTIKTVLTAKLDSSHWTRHLPLIILSINNMYKADLKCSSAELVFGQTLRLPGDLCCNSPQLRISYPSDMVFAMQKFANSCQPIDTRAISSKPEHLPDALQTCTHFFIRNDPIKANLTPTYDGPFLVLSRTKHSFAVLRRDKLCTAAINNIKPAYYFTLPPLEHLESIFPNCQNDSTPHFARPYNFRHTCNVPSRFQNEYVMY